MQTGGTYEVWISRDEMVDFLLYAASLEASVATRSKMSLTNEFRMLMARLEIPVSGWTCLRTGEMRQQIMLDGSGCIGGHCNSCNRARDASMAETHPCRCTRSRSPSWSWCASSSRQRERRSSCQPPSSQRVPFQPGPCRRWWESSVLWEAFWVKVRS